MTDDEIYRGNALFSPCRTWRYSLYRRWTRWSVVPKIAIFIGLNPSTADEKQDDATVRRCMGFARRWGYGGIIVVNLFAYRSKNPRIMMAADDPVGPLNDEVIMRNISIANVVVACWGTRGGFRQRDKAIYKSIPNLMCLGVTKDGFPCHPLFLPYDMELVKYTRGVL